MFGTCSYIGGIQSSRFASLPQVWNHAAAQVRSIESSGRDGHLHPTSGSRRYFRDFLVARNPPPKGDIKEGDLSLGMSGVDGMLEVSLSDLSTTLTPPHLLSSPTSSLPHVVSAPYENELAPS